MTTMKDAFNRCDPNVLPDMLRKVAVGDVLRAQLPQVLRMKTPAADVSQIATLSSFALPTYARATAVTRAYARATTAGGTLGELAVQAVNATPGDGQIAVAPNGQIVVLTASAYTSVDVEYVPARGDVVTLTSQPVVANVFAIPAALTAKGIVYLLSCAAVTGTVTGNNIVIAPGGVSVVATQANLNPAKTSVQFVVADAVTSCTVSLLVVSTATDLDTLLESTDTI
jgi:hypothetical protein